jgi:hypothetical protein
MVNEVREKQVHVLYFHKIISSMLRYFSSVANTKHY